MCPGPPDRKVRRERTDIGKPASRIGKTNFDCRDRAANGEPCRNHLRPSTILADKVKQNTFPIRIAENKTRQSTFGEPCFLQINDITQHLADGRTAYDLQLHVSSF